MSRSWFSGAVLALFLFSFSCATVHADVLNMPPGMTSLEMVTVGNPGNAGELSGAGAGGYGPDRICGAVAYTYQIGKYEVTAGQYTEFLNKVGGVDTYGLYNLEMSRTDYGSGIARSGGGTLSNPYTYVVSSAYANRPVNYVSFWDACRFANWLNNGQPSGTQGASTTERGTYTVDGYSGMDGRTIQRNGGAKWAVASEDEWYKAAYYDPVKPGGAGYWNYPTRSNTAPGQDMADASGNNANCYAAPYARPIDAPYFTTVVGEFQNSAGPYGTFDQGGNVREWNESVVIRNPTLAARGMRGGSLNSNADLLRASNRDEDYYPMYDHALFGFRVAYIPEPTTLGLMGIGLLAVLRRRGGVRPAPKRPDFWTVPGSRPVRPPENRRTRGRFVWGFITKPSAGKCGQSSAWLNRAMTLGGEAPDIR